MRAVKELAKISNEDLFREYVAETDELRKDDIKNEIFTKNEKFSWHIAGKYKTEELSIEDRVALCHFGMLKAFNSFDPDKGIKFATYASRCMANEILMQLRKERKKRGTINLETVVAQDDRNELTLLDVTEDASSHDIERLEQRQAINEILHTAQTLLDEREYYIFTNTIQEEPKTQKELSEELGISQSYISRLEGRILRKVRKLAISKGFIESHEYSGLGIKKLPKPTKLEEPEASPVVESPVTIRHISEIEGAGKNMATLKERVEELMDKRPEMSGTEIAKTLGRPAGTIHTYMSTIRKEREQAKKEKPSALEVSDKIINTPPKKEAKIDLGKIMEREANEKQPKPLIENAVEEFKKEWGAGKREPAVLTAPVEPPKQAPASTMDFQMTDAPAEVVRKMVEAMLGNVVPGERYNICINLERK